MASIVLLAIVVLGFFLIQPGSDSVEGSQAENLLATSEGPVLLEVYSDYWIACMRAEPIVNGLREELDGKLLIVQLNIRDNQNRAFLLELDAQFTPTFILFDDAGQEVWRDVGSLDAELVRQQTKTQ